jgi:hypothetical protein
VPANGKRVRLIKDLWVDEPGAAADDEPQQEELVESEGGAE